jgi:DNA-binding transcriptional regulator YhcF (GntR family)
MKLHSPHSSARIAPGLPDLQELSIEQDRSQRKAALVLNLLRRTAAEFQGQVAQPFYSVRAVSDRFDIPLTTVSRLYRHLSSERLLRLLHGSKTLLEPMRDAKNKQAKTVAIAIALSKFISSPTYRDSILSLQRELWTHRVDVRLLFFEHSDEEVLQLCRRYDSSQIDTLIWLSPSSTTRKTLLHLRHRGIRVVCIGDVPIPGIRECYSLSPARGVNSIVRKKIFNLGI